MGLSLTIAVIFIIVTLGVAAGCYALSGLLSRESSLVRKRVEVEFRKGAQDTAPRSPLFKDLDQIDLSQGQFGSPEDPSPAPPSSRGLLGRLQTLLNQADLQISAQQLLLLAGVLGVVLGLAGTIVRGLYLGLPAALAGTAIPLVFVHLKRKSRRERFLTQLPNAFDLMARVLRSGQSVPQALLAVADSFDGPIAAEFTACQKQQTLGLRPEVAYRDMADRTGLVEMRIFVMAMLIHRQTGGNLSEVLERLADLIRSRLRIRKLVRSLTAEGRLQGITLVILPVLMFGVMMVVNREYAEVLFQHTPLLIGTGVAMLAGILWIRKIVNLDV